MSVILTHMRRHSQACERCGLPTTAKKGRCFPCQSICNCGGPKQVHAGRCIKCAAEAATAAYQADPTHFCLSCFIGIDPPRTVCQLCENDAMRNLLRDQGKPASVVDQHRNHPREAVHSQRNVEYHQISRSSTPGRSNET